MEKIRCDILTFRGSVNRMYIPSDMFPTKYNFTPFIYFWKTVLHVSGGICTHHQEHTQLYLQYLVLGKPLLLPADILDGLALVWVWCGHCIDLFWYGCVPTWRWETLIIWYSVTVLTDPLLAKQKNWKCFIQHIIKEIFNAVSRVVTHMSVMLFDI